MANSTKLPVARIGGHWLVFAIVSIAMALAAAALSIHASANVAYAEGLATASSPVVLQSSLLPKVSIVYASAFKDDDSGAAEVSWTDADSSTIDGYEVQLSTSKSFKSGNKTKRFAVDSANGKIRSFRGNGLKFGKKYYVRVRTYAVSDNKMSYSAWSAKKSFKTYEQRGAYVPKTKITEVNVLHRSDSGAVELKWETVDAYYIDGYQIQLATDKKFRKIAKTRKFDAYYTDAGENGVYRGNGLLKGTKYYARIRTYYAQKTTVRSAWSAVKSFTTYA